MEKDYLLATFKENFWKIIRIGFNCVRSIEEINIAFTNNLNINKYFQFI